MAQSLTMVNTATASSATEEPVTVVKKRRGKSGGATTNGNANAAKDALKAYAKKKYRHVAAVHSKPRTSCLDHDSDATPSFLGFRNLMVIVLGMMGTTDFG